MRTLQLARGPDARLNPLTEIATWDAKLLGEQLREFSEFDLNFDIEATARSIC
jgi:hypothetical protein